MESKQLLFNLWRKGKREKRTYERRRRRRRKKKRERERYFKVSSILFYSTQKTQKLDRIGALKGVPFWIFGLPFCRKTSKKWTGDSLEKKKLSKKVSQCRKKLNGDPLVSLGIVCYGEKRNNFCISVPCDKWSNLAP